MAQYVDIAGSFARSVYQDPEKRVNYLVRVCGLTAGSFDYVAPLSTQHVAVYKVAPRLVFIAWRGTQLSDTKDLGADYLMILPPSPYTGANESSSYRYKQAERDVIRVHRRYRARKLLVCGHSLGGSIAEYIYDKYDYVVNAYLFNPGRAWSALSNSVGGHSRRADWGIYNCSVDGDVISALGRLDKSQIHIIRKQQAGVAAHSSSNF